MCIQSNEIKIINQKRTKNDDKNDDFTKTRRDKKEQQQNVLCVGDIFVFKNDFYALLLLTCNKTKKRDERKFCKSLLFN